MLETYYLPIKALHILSVIAWMAGLLYLPRLFVYHSENKKKQDMYRVFLTMEERLIKMIIVPSACASFFSGALLLHMPCATNWALKTPYLKLSLAFVLLGLQAFFTKCWMDLKKNKNGYSSKFFRVVNEAPFIIAIVMVFLVVLKPF